MIRASFTSKGKLLDNLSVYLASLQENVNATQAQVVAEVEPTAIDELSFTPDASPYSEDNPVPWTSIVQGVAFHASGGFDGGIPHERTNALPDGWIMTNDGNGKTVIANNVPGALYVYGSLAKTNPGAHQQEFLKLIGWPTAYPTVKYWMDYVAEETLKRIKDQFGDLGSVSTTSRAYTRL